MPNTICGQEKKIEHTTGKRNGNGIAMKLGNALHHK